MKINITMPQPTISLEVSSEEFQLIEHALRLVHARVAAVGEDPRHKDDASLMKKARADDRLAHNIRADMAEAYT